MRGTGASQGDAPVPRACRLASEAVVSAAVIGSTGQPSDNDHGTDPE
jgi:hypothetical protein